MRLRHRTRRQVARVRFMRHCHQHHGISLPRLLWNTRQLRGGAGAWCNDKDISDEDMQERTEAIPDTGDGRLRLLCISVVYVYVVVIVAVVVRAATVATAIRKPFGSRLKLQLRKTQQATQATLTYKRGSGAAQ